MMDNIQLSKIVEELYFMGYSYHEAIATVKKLREEGIWE